MANFRKIKRTIEIILFPIIILVVLMFALVAGIILVPPIQKSAVQLAIRVFKLPIALDYHRLRPGLDFVHIDNLDLKIFAEGNTIEISADSIRADFNIRNKEIYLASVYRPDVRIIQLPGDGGGDGASIPNFDIPDFQINRLRLRNGAFAIDDFEINDIGYRGVFISAGGGITLQPDSMGAFLVDRGRVVKASGNVRLEDAIHIDVNLRLARSSLVGSGSITNIDPIGWEFAVQSDFADLIEVDSLLGLGFLDGRGAVKIDLEGYGETVSGYVFIDGEIFTIPAKNTDGQLDFRDNKLTINQLRGSAWGATVTATLEMFFPEDETSSEPIEMLLDGHAKNFNLDAFMDEPGLLPTNLTGRARVSGQLTDTTFQMKIHGDMASSSIFDIYFDSAVGSLFVSEDSVVFYPGFEALRDGNYLTMNGILVFDEEIYVQFGLFAPNLASFTSLADLENTIYGRARVENAEILGSIEHPILSFDLVSDHLITGPAEHDRFLAQATIYDLIESPRGDIYIESEGEFSGIPYDSLLTQVQIHGNRYYIKPFILWGDSITAKGVADVYTEDDSIGIRVQGFELDIYNHPVVLDSSFVFTMKGDSISSTPLYVRVFGGDIVVDHLRGDADNISVGAKIRRLSAQKASDLLPFESVFGDLSGEVFMRMPYSLDGAVGQYEMHLDQLKMNNLDFTRAEVRGDIRDGVIQVDPLIIGRETEQYFLRGWADASEENFPFDFEATIHGTRADLLASFVDEVDSLTGPFDMKLNVTGSTDSLYADGRFTWEKGALGLKSLADPVESLFMDIRLTGDKLEIDSLSGSIGALPVEDKSLWARISRIFRKDRKRYGRFMASGDIDIADPTAPRMNLSVSTRDLPVNMPSEGLFLRHDADISVRGSEPVAIEGRIKINKANLVQLETNGGGDGGLDSLPVELNILLEIPGNAWILTDILESEIGGSINIMTENSALALYGELEVLRGKAFFLGRTFQIRRGRIFFETFEGINPRLDIEAVSRAGEVEIVLSISGLLEEPQINLYAQDRSGNRLQSYSQGDVFSLLALNVEGEEIQGSVLEDRVPQVIQGYLSREVEDVARRTLGVETFEFEPSDQDVFDLSQAKVTIGKYLTDRLYLTYTRSLSFDEATSDIINLEYRLSDHITIQAGREGDIETRDEYKLELQFRWEY